MYVCAGKRRHSLPSLRQSCLPRSAQGDNRQAIATPEMSFSTQAAAVGFFSPAPLRRKLQQPCKRGRRRMPGAARRCAALHYAKRMSQVEWCTQARVFPLISCMRLPFPHAETDEMFKVLAFPLALSAAPAVAFRRVRKGSRYAARNPAFFVLSLILFLSPL